MKYFMKIVSFKMESEGPCNFPGIWCFVCNFLEDSFKLKSITGADQGRDGRFNVTLQFVIILKQFLLAESQSKVTVEYFFQFSNRPSPGNNKKDKSIHQNGANNFPLNRRQ